LAKYLKKRSKTLTGGRRGEVADSVSAFCEAAIAKARGVPGRPKCQEAAACGRMPIDTGVADRVLWVRSNHRTNPKAVEFLALRPDT
jgi:hypothetical protein